MSYCLKTVHERVMMCLADTNLQHSAGEWACKEEQWRKASEEAEKFPLLFIEHLAGLNNIETVKLSFEITVAGCTGLLNRLQCHQSLLQVLSAGYGSKELEKLIGTLLDHLIWLQGSFPLYFPTNGPAPGIIAEKEERKIREKREALKIKLASENISPELSAIIVAPAESLQAETGGNYTFGQLNYLHTVYAALYSVRNLNAVEGNGLTTLINLLIHHNFNEAAFIGFTIKELVQKGGDTLSGNSLVNWIGLEKEMAQVGESGLSLNPASVSVKEALVRACKGEINYLRAKEENLAAVYGSRTTAQAAGNAILTTLSVSQLALWCRLISDCKLIQHSNHTEFLKTIAGALQTSRAARISPESLRVKYYAPDKAAINIVKEHLHQMLNHLKGM